ncbi:MAG TPA: cytochrome C [Lysobacter sp.]|nr:cytochrome C [Lysobacter sp.]
MDIKLPSLLALALVVASSVSGCQAPQPPAGKVAMTDGELLARGDYLVRIAGCNDCHTPGYMDLQGDVDKALWLTGNRLGFRGPWGTTYPSNLRLRMAGMDEAQWLAYSADLHTRPMMPDFAIRAMHEDDRRAIYRFARSLGAAGEPAPAYLPPDQEPPAPYLQLVLPASEDPASAQPPPPS